MKAVLAIAAAAGVMLTVAAANGQPASGPPTPPQDVKLMTLDDCLALAAHNIDVRDSELGVELASAMRSETRGHLGPRIDVAGAVARYTSAYELAVGGVPFRIRDPYTWRAGVTATQPLTGLFALLSEYKQAQTGLDIALLQRDEARRDARFRAELGYLRVLAARSLADVARASVTQLEAQRQQVKSSYDHEVAGRNDVLRVEIAVADARQDVIRADGNIDLSRAQLALDLGLGPQSVDVKPWDKEPVPEPVMSEQAAEASAIEHRTAVASARLKLEQADAEVRAARDRLLPQIDLVLNYTHVDGEPLAQQDAAYVGLNASWTPWDWGSNIASVHVARVRREQADLARDRIADALRMEARTAVVNTNTALHAMDVAQASLAQAEENYRIVTKKHDQNIGTTFDVIDAESVLTQARVRKQTAFYDYMLARANLRSATGGI
ncbi:MAG TPA: TolC family protein [Kofleriaceae bacterium]|jgi:outer membrane protein TolC|nr:TolC family protein [Kofleriaceae bacterium]